MGIIVIIGALYAYYLKEKLLKETKSSTVGLTKTEKYQVLIAEVMSPILAGAILYYGWKKQLPQKAKEANKWSWIISAIIFVLYVSYAAFQIPQLDWK